MITRPPNVSTMEITYVTKCGLVRVTGMNRCISTRLTARGDTIAATSMLGQPEYWYRRVCILLESAGVCAGDRELAQARLRRLAPIPQTHGVCGDVE